MGVSSIAGADRGAHWDYAWNWSNQSAVARYGSLMAHKVGGNAREVLTAGEAAAGRIIGPALKGGPEPGLTLLLPADGVGVTDMPIGQAPGRGHYILALNQTVVEGDLLIPEASTDRVKLRPVGSTVPPVAKALQNVTTTASEAYIQAESMLLGAHADTGQIIFGEGTDTVTAGRFLARSGAHVAPGAAKNTPCIFVALRDCVLSDFQYELEIAPGAGPLDVTCNLQIGADAATANAAAPAVLTTPLTLSLAAKVIRDDTTKITMTQGQCLVAKLTTVAGVGTAEHSRLQFRVQ